MKTITINVPQHGQNENTEIRDELDKFVRENFNLLYAGACRLDENISADYWAPRRVQINRTRLHESQGLKICGGHHIVHDDHEITTEQLLNGIGDIRVLLDAAAKTIES